MSCKHCLFQVPLESKYNFKYRTIVFGNILVVKKKVWGKYKPLYCDTIRKCPVCGDDLLDLNGVPIFPYNRDATLQSLIERFGKEAVDRKMKNFQEID